MGAAKKWQRFKPLPQNIQANLKTLSQLFAGTDIVLVYLFGSLAEQKSGNDVDLAILTENTPPYTLRDQLSVCLNTERIDIVDLRRASPALCFEIIRSGQLLYAVNEEVRFLYELGIVRQYHDTAYLRQRHEEGLKRRMAAWSSSAAAS